MDAPLVAGCVLGPAVRGAGAWSGTPRDFRDAVFAGLPRPPYAGTAPLVLAVVAAVLVVAGHRTARRPAVTVAAPVLGWAAALVLPVVLQLPYAAGLMAHAVVVAAALFFAVRLGRADKRPSPPSLTALLLALVTSVGLALVSLASEPATIAVLGTLTVLFAAAGLRPGPAPFAAPAALCHATALACAIGASAGRPPHHTALLVLVVPAVAALIASRTGGSRTGGSRTGGSRTGGSRATVPVEVAGAAAGLLALALAAPEPPMLALVLSSAVPSRRPPRCARSGGRPVGRRPRCSCWPPGCGWPRGTSPLRRPTRCR